MGNLVGEVESLIDHDDTISKVASVIMQRSTRLSKTHCCMSGLIIFHEQQYLAMRCAAPLLLDGYTTAIQQTYGVLPASPLIV